MYWILKPIIDLCIRVLFFIARRNSTKQFLRSDMNGWIFRSIRSKTRLKRRLPETFARTGRDRQGGTFIYLKKDMRQRDMFALARDYHKPWLPSEVPLPKLREKTSVA